MTPSTNPLACTCVTQSHPHAVPAPAARTTIVRRGLSGTCLLRRWGTLRPNASAHAVTQDNSNSPDWQWGHHRSCRPQMHQRALRSPALDALRATSQWAAASSAPPVAMACSLEQHANISRTHARRRRYSDPPAQVHQPPRHRPRRHGHHRRRCSRRVRRPSHQQCVEPPSRTVAYCHRAQQRDHCVRAAAFSLVQVR